MLAAYSRLLTTRPVVVKAMSAALVFSAADALAQLTLERAQAQAKTAAWRYDAARTGRMALFGLCIAGPGVHSWYWAVERVLGTGTSARHVVLKVAADAAIFSPLSIATFFAGMSVLDPTARANAAAHFVGVMQREFAPSLLACWGFWPPFIAISFRFVPVHYRTLYQNVLSVFWNAFLAYRNASSAKAAASGNNERPSAEL